MEKSNKLDYAEIPSHWEWKRIDTIAKGKDSFFDGNWVLSADMDPLGKVRLLQLSDIGEGSFLDKSSKYINEDKFNELKGKELFEGDIIVSRMASPIARSCIIPKVDYRMMTAVDVAVLRVDTSKYDRVFLNYMFNSNSFMTKAESLARGTTRRRITRKNLGGIEIPLPPFQEQQRIVNRIESLFEKIDKAEALINEAREGFEKRKEAILAKAFRGELTEKWRDEHKSLCASSLLEFISNSLEENYESEKKKYIEECLKVPRKQDRSILGDLKVPEFSIPNTWQWVNLAEIIELLTDYHANGAYKKLKENVRLLDEEDYALMIRATNFEKNNFDSLMKYISKHAYNFLGKSKLFGGEILISKIGNAGSVYYMPELDRPASLAMNLFALRLNKNMNSKYVYYYLKSIYGSKNIMRYVRGVTTKSIDKISVRSIFIPVAPKEEQDEIVELIESIMKNEEVILEKSDLENDISIIKKTILAKAFRGELGSNRSDEEAVISK